MSIPDDLEPQDRDDAPVRADEPAAPHEDVSEGRGGSQKRRDAAAEESSPGPDHAPAPARGRGDLLRRAQHLGLSGAGVALLDMGYVDLGSVRGPTTSV